jgi:hypothetical protein
MDEELLANRFTKIFYKIINRLSFTKKMERTIHSKKK